MTEGVNRVGPDMRKNFINHVIKEEGRAWKLDDMNRHWSICFQQDDDGLRALYNISLLIAKSGKPHTIGKGLILPAINEVIKTMLHKPAFDIIKKIPLSNNTVQRRIDEMAQSVEELLCAFLKATKFSIQLDESTLPGNEALLLAYVRFVKEEKICQGLLFSKNLLTDIKGESIYHTLEEFFKEKEIPMCNIISVTTNGAPAMVGCHRDFIAYLKKTVPNVLPVHSINKIKNNSLNDRLFGQLCTKNDEEFNQLLFHTEIRWLSKGAYSFSNTETIDSAKLEKELIEITTNEELKLKFKEGFQVFWLQKQIPILYPGLWAVVQIFLIAFPSSYLVKRGLSAVTNLLTTKKQWLQITNRGDLRMLLTKIEPNINEILAKHQPHTFHY
ncbi:hypothetical protein AGLY_012284 [Aphis glycines]|uniref:DUF4371 domain-containing protein n=1 Tax=Aphis glycines TaxID=307491 RepID=A0A6G0TA02_APHGL|nr:hypothetical protein AGLY_012284 [Aphis glycines]